MESGIQGNTNTTLTEVKAQNFKAVGDKMFILEDYDDMVAVCSDRTICPCRSTMIRAPMSTQTFASVRKHAIVPPRSSADILVRS